MLSVPRTVDEDTLAEYRDVHLNPLALGSAVAATEGACVLSVPPGVGKSHAAHGLVSIAEFINYDFIIYIAPTRDLIDEFIASKAFIEFSEEPEEDVLILEPRPRKLCGPLDAAWRVLEQQGCALTARDSLCNSCDQRDACPWVDRLHLDLNSIRMVVLTEAYIGLQPKVIDQLIKSRGAQRPLVIIDEGTVFTTDMTRCITIGELEMFAEAIDAVLVSDSAASERRSKLEFWRDGLNDMVDHRGSLLELPSFRSNYLFGCGLEIEAAGLKLFGSNFRNIARTLRGMDRFWYHAGAFYFSPIILTGDADLIVLSPYLHQEVIEVRLGRRVELLDAPDVFRHSQTRFINIEDGAGSAKSMSKPSEFGRIVDFYTALAARNHLAGRRTVLVARKKYLQQIKEHVETLMNELGIPIQIAMPGDPIVSDTSIALINFGIVGVNDYQEFDALYCIGSYYAAPDHVSAVYQQWIPHASRSQLQVALENGARVTKPTQPSVRDRNRAEGAIAVLGVLEKRVVLQAVGRVRPFTSPAEVIFMQQGNYTDVLGDLDQYPNLKAARGAGGIPTRAELKRAVLGERIRLLLAAGQSLREAATQCGVAPSTAARARETPSLQALLEVVKL